MLRLSLSSAVIAFMLTASAGLKSIPLTILAIVMSYVLVDRLFHLREHMTTFTEEAGADGARSPGG